MRKLGILERRLAGAPGMSSDAQGLNMLALTYLDMAFTALAMNEAERARVHLTQMIDKKARIQELCRASADVAREYSRTGEFRTVLIALATKDQGLAKHFLETALIDSEAQAAGPEVSNYFWSTIRALATGDLAGARGLIERRPSNLAPEFSGYDECLDAIAQHDEARFVLALAEAEKRWYRFMKKRFTGHPQAACFLNGAGLLSLAEMTFGKRLAPATCYVPTF